MKAAEGRKKEHERRVERQVQKEREAEHGMYEDKEEFVTGAYKLKMQQRQDEEEEERRQEQMEGENCCLVSLVSPTYLFHRFIDCRVYYTPCSCFLASLIAPTQ